MTMRTEMSLNPILGRRMLSAMSAAKIPAATKNCDVGSDPATASPLNLPSPRETPTEPMAKTARARRARYGIVSIVIPMKVIELPVSPPRDLDIQT